MMRANLESSKLLDYHLPRNEALEKEKEKLKEQLALAERERMNASTEAATKINSLEQELRIVREQLVATEDAKVQMETAKKEVEEARQEAAAARTAQGVAEIRLKSAEQQMKQLSETIQARENEMARANETNRKSVFEIEGLKSANTSLVIKMEQLRADLAHQAQFTKTEAEFQEYFFVCWLSAYKCVIHSYPEVD